MRADWHVAERLTAGMTIAAYSNQFARGDENNQDRNGPVPGYAVMNLDADYRLDAAWDIFAKVNNVLSRRYESYGIVGQNFFLGPNRTIVPADVAAASGSAQFRTPAAPFGIWVGVRYAFK